MLPIPTVRGARAAWAVLPVLFTATACAHVGQDDFDAGLADLRAQMRAEMQEGDEGVARSLGARVDDVEARMERFEADLASLEEQFDVTVEQFETALRFDLPVYFDFDAADVGPEGRVVLERFSDVVLRYYPGATVTVEGFTDPAGSAEYNRRLGQRRADAVRAFLVTHGGLAEDHVRAVSYGEERVRLIAPDETGPGRPGWPTAGSSRSSSTGARPRPASWPTPTPPPSVVSRKCLGHSRHHTREALNRWSGEDLPGWSVGSS